MESIQTKESLPTDAYSEIIGKSKAKASQVLRLANLKEDIFKTTVWSKKLKSKGEVKPQNI